MQDSDWTAACDRVVTELLEAAQVWLPPVDVLEIARRLGWPVVWDAHQQGRARVQRLEGQPTLFVRPEERPERLQWAIAHEIGEVTAWRVCAQLGLAAEELTPRQREEIASQTAQRLLLPTDWFRQASRDCHGDLFALKNRFPTASHELIAWRWLDGEEPTAITIVDHDEVSRRRCNFAARAPAIISEERQCVQQAGAFGAAALSWPGGKAHAWAIHEPQWRREILRTVFDWDAAE